MAQLLEIDPNEAAVALSNLPLDHNGVDVRGVGANHNGGHGVDDWHRVDAVGADQDDVGVLPGRQRPDPVAQSARLRAVRSREPQYVAVLKRGGESDVNIVTETLDAFPGQSGAHLSEHVARHCSGDVDAQAGFDPEVQQLVERWVAMAP